MLPDVYRKLTRNPDFVAGSIDARGGIYPLNHYRPGLNQSIVTSQNEGLLRALNKDHGGKVYPSIYTDRRDGVNDAKSWTWRIVDQIDLKNFLEWVGPYLRYQDILETQSQKLLSVG